MSYIKKPSISELIKLLDKPALLSWANRIGLQGINLDDHRKQTAEKGDSIHLQIQNFIHFKTPFENPETQVKFEKFIEGKEIISVEQKLETEWFVGRLDLKVKINNLVYVCDFKSNNGVYFENYLQLSAYRMAEQADRVAIIQANSFEFKELHVKDFAPYERMIKALSFIYTTKKELGH